MPAEKLTTECPACHRHSLAKHCEVKSCTWAMCRNKDTCDLMFDVRNGRGHRLGDHVTPGGVRPRVNWKWEKKP
jgi:hypothetical protein